MTKNLTSLLLKDGDGDEFDSISVDSFKIDIVHNGFILEVMGEEEDIKEVFTNIDDVFKRIKELF